ncbi:Tim44 domain-containing protein [Desulfovibrio oxyclinae]|uniref:Tim44 domain-containing protein n=1 Tax=Desulfovibrio oxyclinae TaxID=63560 RepID=UPI00037FEC5D|nr:TIM44-like domain-containing protein [Desulfovibrio oxyclinae]
MSLKRILAAAAAVLALPTPAAAAVPGFAGMHVVDLILLGFLVFLLIRVFKRRFGGGQDQRRGPQDGNPPESNSEQEKDASAPRDRYDVARATWDMLSSDSEQPQQPARPKANTSGTDFEPAEFIEGAKLFFTRLQQARDAGTLDELRDFLAPSLYEELKQEAAGGDTARTEVMLVEARLADRRTEDGKTVVSVLFDATLRRGASGETPYNYRGVWEFSRTEGDTDALWTLEKMDRVDH